ncbi:hypothetical protein SDC9_200822 [bioreactor metagenome]|uniref:Uncharacterized protein n=1 Tax=bioreactor metagenome TaxID=1076179 RepID=A0A645IP97_9ZZZZ
MNEVHQQDREKAPGDAAAETDIPVHVELLIGVIPIAHLKEPLHGRAGGVFQQRGRRRAGQVQQDGIISHRKGKQQNHDGSGAVNGQQRPMEKSPVHPPALADGDIAGLPHPAAQTI